MHSRDPGLEKSGASDSENDEERKKKKKKRMQIDTAARISQKIRSVINSKNYECTEHNMKKSSRNNGSMYEEKCSRNGVVRVYLYATATIAAAAAAMATETPALTVKRTCTKLCKLSGIWHNGIAYLFLYIVMAVSHRVRASE